MSSIETEAATLQLEALGFIKISEDGEKMHITDKGIERARDILNKLPVDEAILLIMLSGDMAQYFTEYIEPDEK